MLRVFIGFDRHEIAAYQVCSYSIIKNSSQPVSITPLRIEHFPWFSNAHPLQSTDFAFTRFLVPHLCDFEGWALFMDADMLVRGDIAELFELCDDKYAVRVVQHDYSPKLGHKFLGAQQTDYSRKNWSSVMLFNNSKCRQLTSSFVNSADGLALHQFEWCKGTEIGGLPKTWNHLVGENEDGQFQDPDIVHFTRGGPYFEEFQFCDYSDAWFKYLKEANSVLDRRVVNV
jgi:lipopolysaccharide biosynthesis glycosyltransferase